MLEERLSRVHQLQVARLLEGEAIPDRTGFEELLAFSGKYKEWDSQVQETMGYFKELLEIDETGTSRGFLKGLLKEMHEKGLLHSTSLGLFNVTLESLSSVIRSI